MNNPPNQPHPIWSQLRATCPVSRSADGARATFHVTRWVEADAVLRDPETFSSSINGDNIGKFMGPMLLAMDGREHRAHRALVSHAFRPSQLEKWEHALIRPIIMRLLDEVAPESRAELTEVLCRFPVQVICGMFGVPAADSAKFFSWTLDIHRGAYNVDVGMAAAQAMRAYLTPIVEDRKANPRDDLISDIVHAEIDGQKLSEEEVYGFLLLLLPAGTESTYRALANALVALLSDSVLLTRVRADRSLLPAVIEETLRWEVSNTMVSRVATRDATLGGCPVPAGAQLLVFTSSANHDETRFAQPEAFDIDRPDPRHMGFGAGQHQCLGLHLARLELRVGLNAILDRLPDLKLDPEQPAPVIEGYSFRGPAALHVVFTPSAESSRQR